MTTLDDVVIAARYERLLVKVGAGWFLGAVTKTWDHGEEWIALVEAGPSRATGLITNIDDNAAGREFRFLPA